MGVIHVVLLGFIARVVVMYFSGVLGVRGGIGVDVGGDSSLSSLLEWTSLHFSSSSSIVWYLRVAAPFFSLFLDCLVVGDNAFFSLSPVSLLSFSSYSPSHWSVSLLLLSLSSTSKLLSIVCLSMCMVLTPHYTPLVLPWCRVHRSYYPLLALLPITIIHVLQPLYYPLSSSSLPSLTPDIGLKWYFFTVLFTPYIPLMTCTWLLLSYAPLIPILGKYQCCYYFTLLTLLTIY